MTIPPILLALSQLVSSSASALSQAEVLSAVSEFHPKLSSARKEISAAKAKSREKLGAFDPIFTFNSDLLRYNSSSNPGKSYAASQNEGAVELTTPDGIKLFGGVRLNQGYVKSPASSTGNTGEYFAGLKLPLMRGAGINEKGTALQQAQLQIEVAEYTVGVTRLSMLRDASLAYWEWVASVERKRIADQLLKIAREREEAITKRTNAGDLPRFDSIEASTEVRRREGGAIKAERDVQKAVLKLGLYLWAPDGSPAPAPSSGQAPHLTELVPTVSIDLDALTKASETKRPELLSFAPMEKSLRLARGLAVNDRKPALDLTIGPGIDTGVGSVGPTWKLGLMMSVPLRQNTVDGRIGEADAKLEKLSLDRTMAKQQVKIEIADAASALETCRDRVLAAEAELKLSQQLEQGERTRFNLGEGTLFLLNQRERATAEAAARLIDVCAEYQFASVALQAASGQL